MNSVLLKYSFSYCMRNKKRFLNDLISFSIFIFIFIFIGNLGLSFTTSYQNHIKSTYGSYQFQLVGGNSVSVEKIVSDEMIDVIGRVSCYGYVTNNGVHDLYIGNIDTLASKQLNLQILDGNIPMNENEIMMEESAYYQLSEYIEDNKIKLEFYTTDDILIEQTYFITGIIKNYTNYHLYDNNHRFPGIITPNSDFEPSILLLSLKDENNTEVFFDRYSVEDVALLTNNGLLNSKTNILVSIFKVINILLIIFGFSFLIGTIVSHRIEDKKRVFYIKCCGADNKVLLLTRFYIILFTFLPSLIIGCCLGMLISKVAIESFLVKLIDYIVFLWNKSFFVLSIIISFLSIFTISFIFEMKSFGKRPLETYIKKRKKENSIQSTDSQFMKHPLLIWGIKSFTYNSAKYIFSIITGILLMTVIMFEMSAISSVFDNYQDDSFDYSVGGGFSNAYYSSFQIIRESYTQVYPKDIESITETGEALFCSAYSTQRFHILRNINEDGKFPYSILGTDSFLPPEKILEEKERFGYKDSDELYISTLVTCNDQLLNKLIQYSANPLDSFDANHDVILVCQNDPYFQVGDDVTLTQPILAEDGEIKIITKTAKISAIIPRDDIPMYIDIPTATGHYFAVSETFCRELGVFSGYTNMGIVLKDKSNYEKVDHIISQIKAINGRSCYIVSNREMNLEKQNTIAAIVTISGIIILTLAYINILNLHTICRNDYEDRKQSWGRLRVCGLKKKQAVLNKTIEMIIVSSIAWLTSNFVLFSILSIGLKNVAMAIALFPFHTSLSTYLICNFICFFISFISTNEFWKKTNLVNLIKGV